MILKKKIKAKRRHCLKMKNKKLEFIDKGHRYFYEKKEITSVSKILNEFWPYDYADEKKAKKGTNIHRCTELWDLDKLDFTKTSEYYIPYITGWEKFKLDKKLIHLQCLVEVKMVDPYWMYAGRIDRIFLDYDNFIIYIIDIKTGHVRELRDPMQLYGYAQVLYPLESKIQNIQNYNAKKNHKNINLLKINRNPDVNPAWTFKLYNCYLSNDGSYNSIQAKNMKTGMATFISYLNIYNHQGGLHTQKQSI